MGRLERSGASVTHQCISRQRFCRSKVVQEALNGFLEGEDKTRNRLPTLTIQLHREFNFNQRQAMSLLKFDRKN